MRHTKRELNSIGPTCEKLPRSSDVTTNWKNCVINLTLGQTKTIADKHIKFYENDCGCCLMA